MQAIVIKSIPFEDTGRILTLFTESQGLLSLIIKRIKENDFLLRNISSVLSLSEFHISKGRGDLYRLQDASLLDCFLEIRNDYEKLNHAGAMLKILQQTQEPEKPSPLLFFLLRSYLKNMKASTNPKALELSFYLKTLDHEGLFPHERELSPIAFTPSQWNLVQELCYVKSFARLAELNLAQDLISKLAEFVILCQNL